MNQEAVDPAATIVAITNVSRLPHCLGRGPDPTTKNLAPTFGTKNPLAPLFFWAWPQERALQDCSQTLIRHRMAAVRRLEAATAKHYDGCLRCVQLR